MARIFTSSFLRACRVTGQLLLPHEKSSLMEAGLLRRSSRPRGCKGGRNRIRQVKTIVGNRPASRPASFICKLTDSKHRTPAYQNIPPINSSEPKQQQRPDDSVLTPVHPEERTLPTEYPRYYNTPSVTSPLGTGDHNVVLLSPKHQKVENKVTKREIRPMKDSGIRSFGQWVTQHHWNEVTQAKTTQEKTPAFYRTLNAAVATHFPAKVIRLHVQDKPWISQKIKSAIRRRQRAFRDQDWETWRLLRNKIQKEIKRARSHYYNNRVQNLKKHSPSAWYKEIKVLTGTQKKGMTIQAQGVDPDSHRDMANVINQKFTNVTTSLPPLDRSKLPAYLPSRPPPVVHPWEVYWKLRRIKTNKSPGPDGIDGRLLKEFVYELSEPIVDILNSSLLEGTVPHEWKEAVVVPLPKTSPPSIDHLRPVSLTSLIGKICESFVASWVLQDIRHRICKNQFGCLKGRSTTHCLVNLANHLYKTADTRGSSSTWVLTDFSKAFDLVDHTVAIQHLLELGVRSEIIPWIVSFHTERSQRTRYQGVLSHKKQLTCGLAQGTKLGPIVFIAHVNNLPNIMRSPSWAFVDDLNLIESRRTSEPPRLQHDLDELSTWTEENKMKLNPTFKCKAMHICFARNPPPPPPLSINGHVLEVVPIAKCLGVTFQANLGWDSQVREMTRKGNQRLYLLCRLRQFDLPVEDLLTVYKSFVRPVVEYAAPFAKKLLNSEEYRGWLPELRGDVSDVDRYLSTYYLPLHRISATAEAGHQSTDKEVKVDG
ncbi:hypothetical protein Bbelb_391610 [Branchiostoma belcheri]|nr:hypothetical protein Bbelb_391610 [Branchiostoma belcheri]